jgi:hypothetical protein
MREETVTIELVNGSKFTVKDFLGDIERWLEPKMASPTRA